MGEDCRCGSSLAAPRQGRWRYKKSSVEEAEAREVWTRRKGLKVSKQQVVHCESGSPREHVQCEGSLYTPLHTPSQLRSLWGSRAAQGAPSTLEPRSVTLPTDTCSVYTAIPGGPAVKQAGIVNTAKDAPKTGLGGTPGHRGAAGRPVRAAPLTLPRGPRSVCTETACQPEVFPGQSI